MNIKAIIFDWARTLYDRDQGGEFSKADDVLQYCQQKNYRLALVSLLTQKNSPGATLEMRRIEIENSPLRKYFEIVRVTDTDKDALFEQVVKHFGLPYEDILVVDDRTVRGIKWANQKGCQSVWIKKGRFANELPSAETGQPTYTIHKLNELPVILNS